MGPRSVIESWEGLPTYTPRASLSPRWPLDDVGCTFPGPHVDPPQGQPRRALRAGAFFIDLGSQKVIWPANPMKAATKASPENSQVRAASPLRLPALRRGMTSPI